MTPELEYNRGCRKQRTLVNDTPEARIAFLRRLRAVRQFRPDPLPDAVLHDVLEVARWSGSAGNRQPWEFVVVRDRDMLAQLSKIDGANAGHLETAAVGIAIVIHPEVADLDAYDEGRLAERILLAASAHGLGAAVGHFTGPDDSWAASMEAKRLLGIPRDRLLRETISLGYPAQHLQRTPNPPGRKPLDQLVHWERY
jgi:nitroreductase